ncbi:hypothetical protein Gbem_2740 [Citrifermentans bemidjiense Bem]|uniref:Uncharacterized protein n=1 Tax=Citrifermentans bemidjiense (strain ATCC BAA-1014 / DSM 16622 / JCM 12645 / Bem) TaxID=404380 RepID=B5EHU5_CITBB|nr:MXAN_6640 family putative metalloprotease [Citrifermentans bemidjiense]ACH39744.1 hypothetical protein Gbem_2740 [Citrifermentans bemidjiense Bem]
MALFSKMRAVLMLLLIPVAASAAPLDDYYLSKLGERAQLAKALSAVVGLETGPAERCRTGLYRSLKRDFKALEPATQKTLAKYVARPVLSSEAVYVSPGGHFNIHYATSGSDAPVLTDTTPANGIPDWVERVAQVFEYVYADEVTAKGYRPPPVSGRYDVYLRDLLTEQAYGYTKFDSVPASAVSVPSYIEIDKAFSDHIFTVNGLYSSDQMLQITAAHEFHHAIQFGYNYYFDIWYGEVTSTWMEDEVYDSVNQCYSYLPKYLPLASTISLNMGLYQNSEYGRWIFNRYLAERHGAGAVKAAWEKLATLQPSSSPTTSDGDIQMGPVLDSVLSTSYSSSLSADFLGFAKKVYTRDWNTHIPDISMIPLHAVAATYSSYPVNISSTDRPSVTLPRYTFAFYRFVPSPVITTFNVRITKTSGIQTALFKKESGVVSEISADTGGNAYSVIGFNALNPASDEVVLLVANTTDVDNHQANFSTDGSSLNVSEPTVAASAGGGGGSSGGGCFIATAAYGSYLHPKVAELRQFRDRHLLTNAPGRLFVSLYYRLSPPIAEIIAEHEWMKGGVRVMLVPVVLSVEHPAGALAAVLLLMGGAGVVRRRKLALVRVRR